MPMRRSIASSCCVCRMVSRLTNIRRFRPRVGKRRSMFHFWGLMMMTMVVVMMTLTGNDVDDGNDQLCPPFVGVVIINKTPPPPPRSHAGARSGTSPGPRRHVQELRGVGILTCSSWPCGTVALDTSRSARRPRSTVTCTSFSGPGKRVPLVQDQVSDARGAGWTSGCGCVDSGRGRALGVALEFTTPLHFPEMALLVLTPGQCLEPRSRARHQWWLVRFWFGLGSNCRRWRCFCFGKV